MKEKTKERMALFLIILAVILLGLILLATQVDINHLGDIIITIVVIYFIALFILAYHEPFEEDIRQ